MTLDSLFLQTVALVNEPPGSLVYHLVLLFALEAATLLAVARWRQSQAPAEARLALGLTAIFVVQLVAFAVAVLAAVGLLDPLVYLPPLDRAASAFTLLALIWVFALPEPERTGDVLASGAAAATVVGLGLSALFWAQEVAAGTAFYNGSPQETAWELGQLALLAAGIVILVVRRQPDWALGVGLLALLLVGHVIHYLFPLGGASVPGAERLARIVALPLLTALAFRQPTRAAADRDLYEQHPPQPAWPVAAPPPAPESAPTEMAVRDDGRRRWALDPKAMVALISVSTASNPSEVAQIITMAVARSFIADLCLLIAPPDVSGRASIATAFNLIGEKFLRPVAALPTGEMPELSAAFNRGEAVRLTLPAHEAELRRITDALEMERPGPAVVVPLTGATGGLLGVLALVSPFAQREWTSEDQNLLMAIVEPIVAALDQAERIGQLAEAAAQKEQELQAAGAANAELIASVDQWKEELDNTRAEMERQRQEADELVREIQAQQAAGSDQSEQLQTIEQLQAQLQTAQMRAAETTRLQAELDAALERLKGLAQLETELDRTREQADLESQQHLQLARELESTRAELRRLTEQQAAVGAGKPADAAVLVAAQQTLQTLQAKFNEQTAALTQARGELAEKEKHLAALEQEVEAARALASGGDTRLLVSQLSSSMEVIASLSQELRQPMSSIVGYSDLLMGESVGILGALQRKFLERIKASTERMGALLDDLIRVTALDSGKLELTREALDVVRVVEDAILSVGAQFREKGINLKLDIADDLPPLTADRDALKQILGHLLNNAGSASAIDGEVTLTLQRETEQPHGGDPIQYLFLSVRDSGGGIAPEDQPRVFSRLYRADAPLIAGLGDTGVGLSIAKALVEAHAGRIWVNSDMGQGSTFCVLLPANSGPGGNGSNPH